MELKIYSIRDSKGDVFNPPFYAKTHGEAEREFTMACRRENSPAAQFPEDYDLYFIGTYDNTSGKIQANDTPQHVVKAVQVLTKQ